MNAKRWSLLGAFAGGALSGGVLIGWGVEHIRYVESADAREVPRERATEHAAPRSEPTLAPANAERNPARAQRADSEATDETSTEAGNSVADVLTRLEAEYRREKTQASSAEPSAIAPMAAASAGPPHDSDTNAVSEPSAVNAPAGEAAAPVAAPALPPSVPPPPPRWFASNGASSPVDVGPPAGPPPAAAEEPALPVASAGDVQDYPPADSGQQAISDQLQQVASLQTVTLVQQAMLAQQLALLQYFQLFPPSSNPRFSSVQGSRPGSGGRIGDTRPSSISATDNPWGFRFRAPSLVR